MLKSSLSYIKKHITENKVDAALISSLSNIYYLTDFYYFTDIEREAFILVTQKNNYIFTDARYSHAVKTNLKNYKLMEITTGSPFTKLLENIIKKEKIKLLGIEENNLTVEEHKKILSAIELTKALDLSTLRTIKNKTEIEKIKKACEIGDKAIAYVLKNIKAGVTEKETALQLETFMRQHGCQPSFPTIVAFQENAAVPHHKTGNRTLKNNELILIDSGVKYEEYCSDMTRTSFFGKAANRQKKVFETVYNAQKKAIAYIENALIKKSEVKGSDADKAARDFIIDNGYPSFPHGLGHGVGLQVHESPRLSPLSKDILKEGMVFSIEPGIYIPNKFGVQIEDLFTIVGNKLIQLTKSPNDFLEIYGF